MPASTASAPERQPRRSRLPAQSAHPASPGPFRRTELTAALGVAVLVAHLLFAQVTLILTACAVLTGRATRWRPAWLVVPAVTGLVWVAAIGAGRSLAGFVAGPRAVAAYLAGTFGHPARLMHLSAAFSGSGHWLPRQIPAALVLAAAEAAAVAWAGGPGRAGRPSRAGGQAWTGGPRRARRRRATGSDQPGYRPGLVLAVRRRLTTAALAGGGVVTRDGCGLGLDAASGRRAELSWAEAHSGVLTVCADPAAAARASFPLACAAVRRRKSVIVIDLTGSAWLAEALAAVCEAAGGPLSRFSSAGPGCYEPFRSHPPARAANLVAQMIDWTGTTDQQRQACERYLADAFAVLAAGPVAAVLDGLIALMEPAALRGAMSRYPGHLPHREALARRVTGSVAALAAEPAAGAALCGQLHRLRSSGPGRWLRGGGAAAPVSIGQAVRDRGGVLFSLDRAIDEEPAAMIARLAVADLTAVLRGLRDLHLRGDALAWVHGCEAVDRPSLAGLLALGPATGTAVLLSTASAAAAASLAPAARVVVTGGPADQVLAARLAELAEFRGEGSQQDVAELLRWQDEDEFALIARGPRPRFRPACRSVPTAWARLR